MDRKLLERNIKSVDDNVARNMKAQASLQDLTVPGIWEKAARFYLKEALGIDLPYEVKEEKPAEAAA